MKVPISNVSKIDDNVSTYSIDLNLNGIPLLFRIMYKICVQFKKNKFSELILLSIFRGNVFEYQTECELELK